MQSPQTLLITGAAGFCGTNFVHYWRRTHPADRIIALDALTYAGRRENLALFSADPHVVFVHGDICDSELLLQVLQQYGPKMVVHFAAESNVDRSIHGPEAFVRANVLGTQRLLEACRQVWLKDGAVHRFHHISTDEVFGPVTDGGCAEEDARYAPTSPYAASKAAADHLVMSYGRTYGLRVSLSRCSNNYGPYQFPEKLIPLVIINILRGKSLPLYGDGRYERSWLHVDDHCRGIEAILKHGEQGESYNLPGPALLSNVDLVRTLCQLTDELFVQDSNLAARFPDAPPAKDRASESLITHVRDRPGHDRRYAMCGAKAQQRLHFQPLVQLLDGLRATLNWYIEQELWWRTALDEHYNAWLRQQYGWQSE